MVFLPGVEKPTDSTPVMIKLGETPGTYSCYTPTVTSHTYPEYVCAPTMQVELFPSEDDNR